ncbi:MAG TPA: hypothetical protein VMM55_04375 [Thermohalobaculum sp.]|nr:hypothetical protein [Thermohalobaculum sp.]
MSGLAVTAVSALAILGTAVLTLGIGWAALARDGQLKVHALSLGAVGPLVTLLAAVFWGDGRMIVTALLLFAFLVVASAASAHALMRLVDRGGSARDAGPSAPARRRD